MYINSTHKDLYTFAIVRNFRPAELVEGLSTKIFAFPRLLPLTLNLVSNLFRAGSKGASAADCSSFSLEPAAEVDAADSCDCKRCDTSGICRLETFETDFGFKPSIDPIFASYYSACVLSAIFIVFCLYVIQ